MARKPFESPVSPDQLASAIGKKSTGTVYRWIDHCWTLERGLSLVSEDPLRIDPADANEVVSKWKSLRRVKWPTAYELAQQAGVARSTITPLVRPESEGGLACNGLADGERWTWALRQRGPNEHPVMAVHPRLAAKILKRYGEQEDEVPDGRILLCEAPKRFPPLTATFIRRNLPLEYYRRRTKTGELRRRAHVSVDSVARLQSDYKLRNAPPPLRLPFEGKTYIWITDAERIYDVPVKAWKQTGKCTWLPGGKLPDMKQLAVPAELRWRTKRAVASFALEEDVATAATNKEARKNQTEDGIADEGKVSLADAAKRIGVSRSRVSLAVRDGTWEGVPITKVRQKQLTASGAWQRRPAVLVSELHQVHVARNKRLGLPEPADPAKTRAPNGQPPANRTDNAAAANDQANLSASSEPRKGGRPEKRPKLLEIYDRMKAENPDATQKEVCAQHNIERGRFLKDEGKATPRVLQRKLTYRKSGK